MAEGGERQSQRGEMGGRGQQEGTGGQFARQRSHEQHGRSREQYGQRTGGTGQQYQGQPGSQKYGQTGQQQYGQSGQQRYEQTGQPHRGQSDRGQSGQGFRGQSMQGQFGQQRQPREQQSQGQQGQFAQQQGQHGQHGQSQQSRGQRGRPQPARGQQTRQQRSRGQFGQHRQRQQMGRSRLQPANIDEILQREVVTADRDTPIATVVAAMAEYDVGSVVVVEDEKPVGILTDRKIAVSLEHMPDVSERTADDLLSESLVTGTEDMTVFEALDRMSDADIRRLPVVDDDGSLIGIVTLDDLLYVLGRELQKATSIIEAQSPRI